MLSHLGTVLICATVLVLPRAMLEVKADGQCTEDIRQGFHLIKINTPSRQIGSLVSDIDQQQCFSMCCDLIQSDQCNTATLFRYQGRMVCLLAQCSPLASCIWGQDTESNNLESVAALISPKVDWGTLTGSASAGANSNATGPTTQRPIETTQNSVNMSVSGVEELTTQGGNLAPVTAEVVAQNVTSGNSEVGVAVTASPLAGVGAGVVPVGGPGASSAGLGTGSVPTGGTGAASTNFGSVPVGGAGASAGLGTGGGLGSASTNFGSVPVGGAGASSAGQGAGSVPTGGAGASSAGLGTGLVPSGGAGASPNNFGSVPVGGAGASSTNFGSIPVGQAGASGVGAGQAPAGGMSPSGAVQNPAVGAGAGTGVGGMVNPVTTPAATTTSSNDDGGNWFWNWAFAGSDEEEETTTQGQNPTTQNSNSYNSFSAVNVPSKPIGSYDSSHNPVGAKQNPAPTENKPVPVYDGYGNPIPESKTDIFGRPIVDTTTTNPFDTTSDSYYYDEDDGWDEWLSEQKNLNGWDDDFDDENLATPKPGLSDFGSNSFPSVQESGRKLVSSDAHKPPISGSTFDSTKKFLAIKDTNRPIIIAGLCSLIVMVLLIIMFMVRKTCSEKDRSRYRPLRDDSFSEFAYHDHPQGP